ncbi:MAG: PilT/PilU family type 4a pilus ATPase [Arenicellales bacterium]
MDLAPYLKLMVDKKASDVYFSTGAPVMIAIEGKTMRVGEQILRPGVVKQMAYSIMNDDQQKEFEEIMEMNCAISAQGLGRFRVNVFRQRGEVSMVVRYIKSEIASVEELKLPSILNDLIMIKRGLILMVGATGSGKSTTLAAMIDYRNSNSAGHILTIEDPIEFIHKHKKSVVNQREVGIDTVSYENALKNAMREAPNVILIGEIRDRDTMKHAIAYAETGHLCLSTLHANNSNQAVDRIINFFPDTAHQQLFVDLSLNMRAIISQRLVIGIDKQRIPAVEVMLNSPYIASLIEKGEIHELKDVMEQSKDQGMQTFDGALYDLYMASKITLDEALKNADSRNNLMVKIRLAEGAKEQEEKDQFSVSE